MSFVGGRSAPGTNQSELDAKRREEARQEFVKRRKSGFGFSSTILTSLSNPGQPKEKLGQ